MAAEKREHTRQHDKIDSLKLNIFTHQISNKINDI